jgi:hypothetical protein
LFSSSSLFFLLRLRFRVCLLFSFAFLFSAFFPHFFRIIFLPCFFRISFFLSKKRNARKEKVLSGYVDGPRLPGDGNHRRMELWRRNSQVCRCLWTFVCFLGPWGVLLA